MAILAYFAERRSPMSALFFEFFFFGRTETRRRTQRFAVIEDRQIADVKRKRARWRLLVDDDSDRTTLDAFAKRDPATTGEPSVCESLQHRPDHTTRQADEYAWRSP